MTNPITVTTYPRTLADLIAANKSEHADWVAKGLTDPSPGTDLIEVLDEHGNLIEVDEEFTDGIHRCWNFGCGTHFAPGISGVSGHGLFGAVEAFCNDCLRDQR